MSKRQNQYGFVPMLIVFLIVIAAVIYLAFTQVLSHQK
jgi:hypothetical protein